MRIFGCQNLVLRLVRDESGLAGCGSRRQSGGSGPFVISCQHDALLHVGANYAKERSHTLRSIISLSFFSISAFAGSCSPVPDFVAASAASDPMACSEAGAASPRLSSDSTFSALRAGVADNACHRRVCIRARVGAGSVLERRESMGLWTWVRHVIDLVAEREAEDVRGRDCRRKFRVSIVSQYIAGMQGVEVV